MSDTSNGSSLSNTNQEEYMQLYRDMQQAAASASTATSATATATAASLEAQSSSLPLTASSIGAASHDGDDSDKDSDVDETNSRFIFPGLSYTRADADKFRLAAWVPKLKSHTIPTRFIPLTQEFVEYIKEEGVWIPEEHAPVKSSDFLDREEADDDDEKECKARVEEIDTSDEEAEAADLALKARQALRASQPFFPELMSQFSTALQQLGANVFPCLDFHAPNDATWIMTERTAKCQTIGEILLLLKSSDKVQRELEEPFEHCSESTPSDSTTAATSTTSSTAASSSSTAPATTTSPFLPTLALRKWSTLHPSKLFRCFVYRHTLLAITQMDPNFYEFLQSPSVKDGIQDAVEAWLEDDIDPVLTDHGLTNYVLDIYIDLQDRVWLVKLKPFFPRLTKSLLFSWKELYDLSRAHDESEARKAEMRAHNPAVAPPSSTITPESSALWPDSSSLTVPFRVIPSTAAGMDILRTMDTMATRFPVEGFDVSDSAAIERWIQRVEVGDLKQK